MSLVDLPEYLPLQLAVERYSVSPDILQRAIDDGTVAAAMANDKVIVSDVDVAIVAAQTLDRDDDELVSISEAARRLDVSPGTIWQWYHFGWLKEQGRGPNRAIYVSWRQAQALEDLRKRRGKQGQRLIPRGMEIRNSVKALS